MDSYKTVKRDGITAALINRKRILLLKRRRIPLVVNGGVWYLLSGGLKRHKSHLETAYCEIEEETGITKDHLSLLKEANIIILDPKRGIKWENRFFVCCSGSDRVKLNLEHVLYKWVGYSDLLNETELLGIIENRKEVLKLISTSIHLCKKAV